MHGMQQMHGMQHQQHFPQFANQPRPPTGPPPQFNMMNAGPSVPGAKVFVGQLPYSKNESHLRQLFGSLGQVVEVTILKDKKTNEKKGAAFIRYNNADSANAAVAALDGFVFSGSPRAITVSLASSEAGEPGHKRSWSSTHLSAA